MVSLILFITSLLFNINHSKTHKQLSCKIGDIFVFQDFVARSTYLLTNAQNTPNDETLVKQWEDWVYDNALPSLHYQLNFNDATFVEYNSIEELLDQDTGIIGATKHYFNFMLNGMMGFADCPKHSQTAEYTQRIVNLNREASLQNTVNSIVGKWRFQKVNGKWKVSDAIFDEFLFGTFNATNLYFQYQLPN
eukprot:423561_1